MLHRWTGEGSPVEWVVSKNLHRRQLTTSQRALVAAGLVPMFEAEAKARMVAAHAAPANLREQDKGTSAAKAAAAVNVSPRLVEAARKLEREAPMETVAAIRPGERGLLVPTLPPTARPLACPAGR